MKYPILKDVYYMMASIDRAIHGLKRMGTGYGGQVGCTLVGSDGAIIIGSYNQAIDGRRAHAEEIVIASAQGTDLSDAALYLTIEPCNGNPFHTRRHCCEQIADAGIQRVVIGSGKGKYEGGADYLRAHGVEVDFLQHDLINTLCMMLTATPGAGEGISSTSLRRILAARANLHFTF